VEGSEVCFQYTTDTVIHIKKSRQRSLNTVNFLMENKIRKPVTRLADHSKLLMFLVLWKAFLIGTEIDSIASAK
jgi:hypothetical protein